MRGRSPVRVVALAAVLVVTITLIIGKVTVLPVVDRAAVAVATGGRDHLFEAVVRLDKYPEDDPWAGQGDRVFIGESASLTILPTTITVRQVVQFINITTFYSTLDGVTYYAIHFYRIRAELMHGSTITTDINLWNSNQNTYYLYIPSRTYLGNTMYRWTITIPAFVSPTLRIYPYVRPNGVSTTSGTAPSMSVRCAYIDPSTGNRVTSTSDLSFTVVSRTRVNTTHVNITFRISFGSSWNNRQLVGCVVFTTDSSYISDLNNVPRNMNAAASMLLIWHEYSAVILAGDTITYSVWYVAPAGI